MKIKMRQTSRGWFWFAALWVLRGQESEIWIGPYDDPELAYSEARAEIGMI